MAENGVDYGLTTTGFVPKRMADIIDEMNLEIGAIVDPTTGELPFQNIEDDAILQRVVGIFGEQLSIAWGALADVYLQFDPLANTGAGQSATVQLNGIQRKTGTATIAEFKLTGIPGVVIPAGSIISDATGEIRFALNDSVTLEGAGQDGQATVNGTCLTTGDIQPEPGEINVIQTANINGWFGATNTNSLVVGTSAETDEQLRLRQQVSTSTTSYRQIDAIYSAIRNLDGVIYCRAYQNATEYPYDSRGIPFKEVAVVVEGGQNQEIAEALFRRFPVGVQGHGDVVVICEDLQGATYPIAFTRPTNVPIFVSLSIAVTNRAFFPDNGAELIKQAIIDYAEYNGKEDSGFPPGTPIVLSRLYTPINSISGFSVRSLQIGTSSSTMGTADIPIAWNQVGRFFEENITVTFVD